MAINASDAVRAFFFNGTAVPADGETRIDVLDSWTTSDLSAVKPTTISWNEGRDD